jgi:hypothetical protein
VALGELADDLGQIALSPVEGMGRAEGPRER